MIVAISRDIPGFKPHIFPDSSLTREFFPISNGLFSFPIEFLLVFLSVDFARRNVCGSFIARIGLIAQTLRFFSYNTWQVGSYHVWKNCVFILGMRHLGYSQMLCRLSPNQL